MSRRINCINIVPEEILTYNIFCRLPVKSLGQCKCVSKSWNSLISQPQFIKSHLTITSEENDTTKIILISPKPDPGFFYSIYVEKNNCYLMKYVFGPKLNFECSKTWSRIWGSCHGLILAEDNRTWTSMYLLNPTTFEFKMLPLLSCHRRNSCIFGFGYDSSCDDYAVVAIAYRQDSLKKDARVYVYMLKTNEWNRVGLSPYDHKCNNPVAGKLVGGCLHWLAKNVDDSSWLISAFNIANKKFSQVPIPDRDSNEVFELGAIRGCLCIFNNVNGLMTELWVMNEYGVVESWVKFSTVPPGLIYRMAENTLVVLECSTVVLLVTNAKEGKFHICKKGFLSKTDFEVGIPYVDSLISPNKKDENKKRNRGSSSKTIK